MHACAVGCIEKKPYRDYRQREHMHRGGSKKPKFWFSTLFNFLAFPLQCTLFFSLKLPLSVGRNCFHSDTKTLTSGRAFAAAEECSIRTISSECTTYRMHAVKYSPSPPLSFPDAKEFLNSFIPILFHFPPQSIQMSARIKVCCPHHTSLLCYSPKWSITETEIF